MPATVIDTRTATGAATFTGITSESNGTAISASPNPKAERITVATKSTASTSTSVESKDMQFIVLASGGTP